MQRILLCAILAALMHAAAATATTDAAATRGALQALAVHVKQALDHPGDPHAPADIAQLRAQLAGLAAGANADPASALAQKYRAVTRLVDELARARAQPATDARAPQKPVSLDHERLGATRGASCANALGVSFALPVEIALADAGQSGAAAWFRLEPGSAGHVQFTTDSSGADPALAVYRDCRAAAVAQNDDARGLDAYVDVAVDAQAPLYVQVSNGGSGGKVTLSASNADASLSGTVTDAASGVPLPYAQVALFNPDGSYAPGYTYADSSGAWSITTYPGQYYVRVNAGLHVTALYPNATCSLAYYQTPLQNCDVANASLVTATSGSSVTHIDVALGTGQRIAGIVRDAADNPLPSAQVYLLDAFNNSLAFEYTDAAGRYLFSAVPNGSYFIRASGGYYAMYGAQLYDHVACGGPVATNCDLSQATPVVIAGNDLLTANFNLPKSASIHGTVHTTSTAYNSYVYALTSSGQFVMSAYVDGQGNYALGPLAAGAYYVYATSYGYFPQLYPGVNCTPGCQSDLPSGTAITISQPGDSPTADFNLIPVPTQTGHVQDALTGQPLAGVFVTASTDFPPTGSGLSGTYTNANGDYLLSPSGVGDFYIWAESSDHIDLLYPAIVCETPNYYYGPVTCDPSGAVRANVTATTTTLPAKNFALQPSSSFSGSVGIRATNLAALATYVQAVDTSGTQLGYANVDANGNYTIADLVPGTYYAVALGGYYTNYLTQLWRGVDCPAAACDLSQGTPIALAANSQLSGIDFSLLRLDAVVGQVLDSRSNLPIPGVLVDLFDANSLAYVSSGATDVQGNYLVSATLGGSYFVATESWGAYVNQIWSGVTCPLGSAYLRQCPFTNATAVPLASSATQAHIANFTLSAPDEIFKGDFE